MPEVRNIRDVNEQRQFSRLAAYCFQDETGWTNELFPLIPNDRAIGVFDGQRLIGGLLVKDFSGFMYDEPVRFSGIACVMSTPEYRNNGHVKLIMPQVIQDNFQSGYVLSALYPFKFRFYENFGYGSLGHNYHYSFLPQSIRFHQPPAGTLVPFDESEKQIGDIFKVHERWIQQFDFGISLPTPERQKFLDNLSREKDHIFLYYDASGACAGFIRFHLKSLEPFVTRMELRQIAYATPEAFRALMYLLWTHRDQCNEITWMAPVGIPVNWVTVEPRMSQKCIYSWMARPLNVPLLLQMKSRQHPVNGKISFSIEDEIIGENTGTYIIEGDQVKKESYQTSNKIPFSLFSSMIFGGISMQQAQLIAPLDMPLTSVWEQFFSINQRIYLSQLF